MGARGRHTTTRRSLRAAVCALALAAAAAPGQAQDGLGVGQYGPAVVPLPGEAAGRTISRVKVEISTSSGDRGRDATAQQAARSVTEALVGRVYQPVLIDAALRRLVSDGLVQSASHRPTYEGARNALGIVVSLDVAPERPTEERAARAEPRFPVIIENDRTKLTYILNTGAGVYSDANAWFGAPQLFNAGNPLAGELPGDRATWGEGYLEFGIGGATRIGDSRFFAFGAASGLLSFSRGQDIFTESRRQIVRPEKGYAGLLYADPDSGTSAKLSFGRQTWTLNDGFLISMVAGSSNAGERGATYLGPRNSTDFSALFTGEFGKSKVSLFYIDPDELEDLESNTTFAGANFGYRFSDAFSADASVITIPNSDSTYRTPAGVSLEREGTTTYGFHALYRPPTSDHAWLEAEYYHQTNKHYDMSANAYYGTVGYIIGSARWSPSISYRFASFSGDDPDTETFERFDSMMSTGLGNWLQGVSFGKVYRNANLNTHRVQFNVSPRDNMNLTFTWHQLRADELNNLGGNPALSQLVSRDIGEEYTAALRWAINRNYYLQLVASRAFPGRALKEIGADDPWSTLQASIYVSF